MERKHYIDFMKGIAIIGVIVIHIATERLSQCYNVTDLIIYEAFYGLARFSVPFFFMVTGYLMLRPSKELSLKKLYLNYILRIIVAAFVYGIIYKIERMILDNSYDGILGFVKGYVVEFATGKLEFHFWYVYAIVGVYIAIPILRAFIKSADRRLIEYFLIVWVIANLFFVISKSGYIPFVSNVLDQYHFVGMFVEYLGYPVLGFYLMNYDFSKKVRIISVVVGLLFIVVAIGLTVYDVVLYGQYRIEYMAYCGIFVMAYSVGMCFIFKNLSLKYDSFVPKIIYKLGQNTLGMYFIHMVFVILIFQYNICNYQIFPVVDMIIYTLIVLLLSAAVTFVIQKIPYVNRWL